MFPDKTYRILLDVILALPEGRRKTVLARKALAAFMGYASTRSLASAGIAGDGEAMQALRGLLGQGLSLELPRGQEPKDPTDKGSGKVSLEAEMDAVWKDHRREAESVVARARELAADGLEEDAVDEIAQAMDRLAPDLRSVLAPALEPFVETVPFAKACLGKALLSGDGVPADERRAQRLLSEASCSDDAESAAVASYWLGEYLARRGEPGDMRRAINLLEAGGRLGNPVSAFAAARRLEESDPARAASGYRLAVELGSLEALTNLALMLARRSTPASEGEDWEKMLRRAARLGDALASQALRAIGSIRRSGSDEDALARELQAIHELRTKNVTQTTLSCLASVIPIG